MDEEIGGFTMQALAESMSKHNELRAQFGEAEGRRAFAGWLGERGHDEDGWARAWNAWLERFRADPTGMLEARFHQIESQLSTKAHFGDVRDMTQDAIEGVTLDQYAQLCVEMGKPGIDADAVAQKFGLPGAAKWQEVNTAWAAKMSQDTTFALTTQYGALYQKYAGPAFAQQQLEQTAAILADANQPKEIAPSKPKDLSQPTLLAQLRSDNQKERWEAARWLAHQWKKDDPSTQVNLECIPVLIEILERHDEHTVSNAEDAVRKLTSDLEQHTDDAQGAMRRCLNRAHEKLASLKAAFAPIQNKAVPERVTLQSRIQDYTSLIDTLESTLADWRAPAAVAMPGPRAVATTPARKFPVAAIVVVAVVAVAAFFGWKATHPAPAPGVASAMASASATPSSVEPPSMAAASQTAARPPVPAAPPGHPPKHGKP